MEANFLSRAGFVIVVALSVFTGCDKLKEGFKAAVRTVASATPLGVTARVDVTPVNADQVARFADETELKDEDPVLLPATVTNVSEEPGGPKALVVLPKDHQVTKVAQRDRAFLVVFENPQKPDEMLMGWVDEQAFSGEKVQALTPDAPKAVPECAAGLQRLAGDPEFCARVCTADEGCGEERCTGIARLSNNGVPGNPVRFCVAKLVKKAEFVEKSAVTSIKKSEPKPRVAGATPKPNTVTAPERCSPTCTATCDCAGRPRVAATAVERCSPTCTATCDCAGRPITCSPTCTETCDCAGRPRVAATAVERCTPTCTATCDCAGRPIKCSPTCTETCDCAGRPITCSPTCTDTCDCAGRPIKVAKCSPTCTATCDCAGRPIKCSPTCTDTCDCSGNPIVKVRKGAGSDSEDKPRRKF